MLIDIFRWTFKRSLSSIKSELTFLLMSPVADSFFFFRATSLKKDLPMITIPAWFSTKAKTEKLKREEIEKESKRSGANWRTDTKRDGERQ